MDPTPSMPILLVSVPMIDSAKKEFNANKGLDYFSPKLNSLNIDGVSDF